MSDEPRRGDFSGSGSGRRTWWSAPDSLCRSAGLQFLSLLMAMTAATQVCLAEADGRWPSLSGLGFLILQFVGVIAGGLVIARRGHARSSASWGSAAILFVALTSLLGYGLLSWLRPADHTLEILGLAGLRNLALTSAIFSIWMRFQRLTVLLSFFVTLFAATISQYAPLMPGMVVFATLGTAWLYGLHWHELQGQRLESTRINSKYQWLVMPLAWLLLVAGMFAFSHASSTGALRGFLPSSGGDRWFHAAAMGGVRDGDNLVAGTQNVQSFAPVEDAPFIPDHQPSLYDTFNDTYEEPVRTKKTERSIPLPPELGAEIERRMAVSQQASRQFSTSRQPKQQKGKAIRNLESAALLYVAGEVPLHLRMETYDLFDGIQWYAESTPHDSNPITLTPRAIHERTWLVLPHRYRALPLFGATRTHAVKLVHLVTDRVPSPLHLHAVHVDLLERGSIFHGRPDGFVHIDRESIPPLIPIHLAWDELDPRLAAKNLKSVPTSRNEFTSVPDLPGMDRIRTLAQTWTADVPSGWTQIMTVIEQLRDEYDHDHDARPPEDHEFPVEHFLFSSRRGPDYQFATAATLMLRSLGYPTRVVSGFHASPRRFDSRRQHTAVLAEDAHFWVEVHLGAGVWASLEPTPGYSLLPPRANWREKLLASLHSIGNALLHYKWLTLTLLTALMLAIRHRYFLLDQCQVMSWKWWPHRLPRRKVLAAMQIIERRGQWARLPRAATTTYREWLLAIDSEANSTELSSFLHAVDWAAFAPAGSPAPGGTIETVCQQALESFSLPRLRTWRRTRDVSGPNEPPGETSAFSAHVSGTPPTIDRHSADRRLVNASTTSSSNNSPSASRDRVVA